MLERVCVAPLPLPSWRLQLRPQVLAPTRALADPAQAWSSWLLSHATQPHDPAAWAHAGVLGRCWSEAGGAVSPAAPVGLSGTDLRQLLERYFPGVAPALAACGLDGPDAAEGAVAAPHPRADEVEDLVALLQGHPCSPDRATSEELRWLAHAVAHASLGQDHLWQDMGLPSRKLLSDLMALYFPSLAARNDRDMKWKKFLYKQLCEREQLFICKAPSCSVCVDQPVCFGPEDGSVA